MELSASAASETYNLPDVVGRDMSLLQEKIANCNYKVRQCIGDKPPDEIADDDRGDKEEEDKYGVKGDIRDYVSLMQDMAKEPLESTMEIPPLLEEDEAARE